MKIFEKRNTSEVKSRRRRFFAFCLVLILSMLPAATVFAKDVVLQAVEDGQFVSTLESHINEPVTAETETANADRLVITSGYMRVQYVDETGADWGDSVNVAGPNYTVESRTKEDGTTRSKWKISQRSIYDDGIFNVVLAPYTEPENRVDPDQHDNPVNPTPSPSPKDDTKKEDSKKDTGSSGKKKYSQSPTSWEGNPDEITAFYFKNGVMDPKAKFGKQEQGAACKAAFASALPAGWKQAFTFSMSVDGKHTSDLKDGMLKMYVPSSFQKAGRQFAIMAIDKNAIVHIYNDSDPQASVIASQLNFEGYAFCLIDKD